jgi:hypothetical protein
MGGAAYATLTPEQKVKAIARGKVNRAVYYGELVRQPCEVCGATEGVEAHHEDYSKPLDVNWLCPTHHKEADAAKRQRDEGESSHVPDRAKPARQGAA